MSEDAKTEFWHYMVVELRVNKGYTSVYLVSSTTIYHPSQPTISFNPAIGTKLIGWKELGK